MITNTGINIIGKYLVGQTASYGSYIAIGCGAKPLSTSSSYGNYTSQVALNFEMFRVPIISRAFVIESGIPKVVLTAELPTLDRYEITEIGLYPSLNNPNLSGLPSQNIAIFSTNAALPSTCPPECP